LYGAGSLGQPGIVDRDAHGAAGERTVAVDLAQPIGAKGRTGELVKSFDQTIDVDISPLVERGGLGEQGKGLLHRGHLLLGPRSDLGLLGRGEEFETVLQRLSIEQGDRKGPDAATMATRAAGNLTEQGGRGPLKPSVGLVGDVGQGMRRWGLHGLLTLPGWGKGRRLNRLWANRSPDRPLGRGHCSSPGRTPRSTH